MRLFAAPPDGAPLPPDQVDATYRHWRLRTMSGIFTGYAVFYFCRKNLSVAMPIMAESGYDTEQLGWLLTGTSIAYGVSKLVNGVLGDRANVRLFMALGLMMSAVANVLFGLSSALWLLALVWIANGWFQGMGWPACARSLTQWYSPGERGTWWGIWNASHQVGGAIILASGGWIAKHMGWRMTFFLPAVIGALVALALLRWLRDRPEELGLPPVEQWRGEAPEQPAGPKPDWRRQLIDHVLCNRYIWYLSLANFCVYIVRFGAMDWAPTFLVQAKGADPVVSGAITASFEVAGIAGAFAAGYASDRFFGGRRGPVSVLYMAALLFAVFEFWVTPPGHPWLDAAALGAVGFLVYGPQMLVGVAAADFAPKDAAATATGFTGMFGYLGGAVSGVGTGWLVKHYGWDGGFMLFIGATVVGMLLFALTWNARAAVCEPASKPH